MHIPKAPLRLVGDDADYDDPEVEAEQADVSEFNNIIDPVSTFRDPASIPRRDWLYGRHYLRGTASATVADGGVGKSSLAVVEGIAMATGRDLLGVAVPKRLNVLYLNLEEPAVEIERRVAAVCQQHRIDAGELEGWFHYQSGLDHPVIVGKMQHGGILTCDDLCETLVFNCFDVIIVDPFNRCHEIGENDNTAVAAVVNVWASIAVRLGCSVEIVHHVRKAPYGGQAETSIADARGASALINAVRSARTLNRMSEAEAQQAHVDDHWQYFRADDGKANYAPAGAATWHRLVPVVIGNNEAVATVVPWRYPAALDNVTEADMLKVRSMAATGDYRSDARSPDWIGLLIASVLKLDAEDDLKRIKSVLKTWLGNGVLKVVTRKDGTRHERSYVVPGDYRD